MAVETRTSPQIEHTDMHLRQITLSAVRVWLVRAGHHCRSVERIHARYVCTSSLRTAFRGCKFTLSPPPPRITYVGMRTRQMILTAARVWLVHAGHHCRSVERIHLRYVYLVAESGLLRLQMHPLTASSPNHVCRHANPLNDFVRLNVLG